LLSLFIDLLFVYSYNNIITRNIFVNPLFSIVFFNGKRYLENATRNAVGVQRKFSLKKKIDCKAW